MAKFRQVHVNFWSDPKVLEEMTPEDRYFYLYLLTNPYTTQIGIYQIAKKQMAFDLGYSIESINSLVERFENHHHLIRYNAETREIAILKWGKYNLTRAGKPMLDCVDQELTQVKDKSLVSEVAAHIPNDDILQRFSRVVDDTSTTRERDGNDTPTTSPREGDNKNKKKNKKNNKKICRANKFDDAQLALAERLFLKIRDHDPEFKQPDLEKWANDIRLMIERDKRSLSEIEKVVDWCQNDDFWHKNILSTAKLRKQFTRLRMEYIEDWKKKKEVQAKVRSPNVIVSKKLERERIARENVLRRYQAYDADSGNEPGRANRKDVPVPRK